MPSSPSPLPLLPLLTLFCAFLLYLTTRLHYSLPTPLGPTPDTFSELLAKTHIDHLASTIGYRILGTRELVEAEEWLWGLLKEYKRDAKGVHGNGVEMEMWKQTGGGSHLFDFMGKKVWKRYHVTNTIVRLSNGTPEGKEHAVLINAHLDSTLPSPGAADDLIGVAVMLDVIRILTTSTSWPSLRHSVIFLFNGAEESLQDASHLFITQHPLRHSVRSVINLEACGVAGREMVFQATSDEMINAYSTIPRPYGTIIGTEIFSSGIILSDTDFRQFEQYGNLTGLDMALVQDSYKYHTRLDTPDRIEYGALQHMGENTLALIRYLATSPSSQLSTIPSRGQPGARPGDTVFWAMFGGKVFVKYSKQTAFMLYVALAAIALPLALGRVKKGRMGAFVLACAGTQVSLIASIVGSNMVAVVMTLLGKPLSWYRHEHLAILLFGPPALLGTLVTQYLIRKAVVGWGMAPTGRQQAERFLEHHTFLAQLATSAVLTLVGQLAGLGSSYVTSIQTQTAIVVALVNDFVLVRNGKVRVVSSGTYFLAALLPTVLGHEGMLSFLDLFVPLTGRMGAEAPVDNIIATVVGGVGSMQLSFLVPLSHRFGDRFLLRSILFSLLLSIAAIAVFSQPADRWALFDHEHPRRVFALHMENVSLPITDKGAFALHIASVDKAPGFETLVRHAMQGVGVKLGAVEAGEATDLIPNQMNDEIPDWDIVYPVSQFLVSYKVPLPQAEASYVSPWRDSFKIRAEVDKLNVVDRTRSLTLVIDHPGIIWSVIAFNADVVEWDLAEAAERGLIRHHIKEVSNFGHDQWRLKMTIQLSAVEFEAAQRISQRDKKQRPGIRLEDDSLGRLRIDFSGLDESGMWPTSKNRGGDRPGMKFLKAMDSQMPDHADLMLLSAISNVAYV